MFQMINVGNRKLACCLKDSIELNSKALDYIHNQIVRFQDNLKYNEDDILSKETLDNLNYII